MTELEHIPHQVYEVTLVNVMGVDLGVYTILIIDGEGDQSIIPVHADGNTSMLPPVTIDVVDWFQLKFIREVHVVVYILPL